MQDYKYEKVNVTFNIIENATNNVVKTGLTQETAKKLTKHLNHGGGFAGFTPDFMLRAL